MQFIPVSIRGYNTDLRAYCCDVAEVQVASEIVLWEVTRCDFHRCVNCISVGKGV
jgi:hypothetical protein